MELAKIIDTLSYIKDLDASSKAIIAADAALLITSPCILGIKNAFFAAAIVDAAIAGLEYSSTENNNLPKIVVDAKDALYSVKDWASSYLASSNTTVTHDVAPTEL